MLTKEDNSIKTAIRSTLELAKQDGGTVIGLIVITYLIRYFGTKLNLFHSSILVGLNTDTNYSNDFLISIIEFLNYAVILTRAASIAKGVKLSLFRCYLYALRKLPMLLVPYIFVAFMLMGSIQLLSKLNDNLIFIAILLFIPLSTFMCIYILDKAYKPIQAITETFRSITHKNNKVLFLQLTFLYSIPWIFNSSIKNSQISPYLGLVFSVWILFCHMLTVVIYSRNNIVKPKEDSAASRAKVISI